MLREVLIFLGDNPITDVQIGFGNQAAHTPHVANVANVVLILNILKQLFDGLTSR